MLTCGGMLYTIGEDLTLWSCSGLFLNLMDPAMLINRLVNGWSLDFTLNVRFTKAEVPFIIWAR